MKPSEAKKYLNNVPEDEPVFVLRAKDYFAPGIVTAWAALALSAKPEHEATRAKGKKAMALAGEMRNFQLLHGGKLPD